MEAKGTTFFKVLCNRFHKGPFDPLFQSQTNAELQKLVSANPCPSEDVQAILEPSEKLLAFIHYSWLLPIVQNLPPQKQGLVLATFSEKQMTGIRKALKLQPTELRWIPGTKELVQRNVLQELKNSHAVPMAYLPNTDLSPLLDLDKDALVKMIECLGIYDLAEEMRKVVDRHRLKIIYSALNPHEQKFLRQCFQYKTRIQSFGMDLHKWSGSVTDLKMQLHRRGMARLGRGLAGQHSQFIWKIVHTLDKGRGERVDTWAASPPKDNVTPVLVGQILNVLNFLQKSTT